MGADDVRRVPVRTVGRRIGSRAAPCTTSAASGCARTTGARTDVLARVVAQIVARDIAVLRLAVNRVLVRRIDARLEAVAAAHVEPVGHLNAPAAIRARRSAHREVVLRAAAHAVERLRVVDLDLVELLNRQVHERAPVQAAIVRLMDATVARREDVIRIGRIERHVMEVHVHVLVLLHLNRLIGLTGEQDLVHVRHRAPRLAAVARPVQRRVSRPDRVGPMRIHEEFAVVRRATADVGAHLFPLETAVDAAVEPTLVGRGMHDRVDDRAAFLQHRLRGLLRCRIGARRRGRRDQPLRIDRQRDASDVALRQTSGQLRELLAAVH